MMSRRYALAWLHGFWQVTFFVLPTVYLVGSSFRSYKIGRPEGGATLNNYIFLFRDSPYGRALAESLLLSGASGLLVTAAATVMVLSAWEILREKGRRGLLLGCAVMFFVGMVPRTLALGFVLSSVGGIGNSSGGAYHILYSTPGLTLAYIVLFLPLSVVLIFISRSAVPAELFDAALDLGASWAHAQRRIVIPLLLPGLTVSVLLVSILTIADIVVADLIGGGEFYTAAAQIIDHFKINDWGRAAAAASVLVGIGTIYLGAVGAFLGGRVKFDE